MEGREVVYGVAMKDIMEARVVAQATQDSHREDEKQAKAMKDMEEKAIARASDKRTSPRALSEPTKCGLLFEEPSTWASAPTSRSAEQQLDQRALCRSARRESPTK